MADVPRCAGCAHLPHPGRGCRVQRVTGPPSTTGKAVGDSYDHGGRTVTECPCHTYTPTINGVDRHD